MKIFIATTFLFVISTMSLPLVGQINRQLDIPARLQWDNANGYCGETSIQMIGLYFGNYISQNSCRTIAGGEVLVSVNEEAILNTLSFTYEAWDYTITSPQYQEYLIWMKKHIYRQHPVITTVYVAGMTDPDYDHIFCSTGFSAADTSTFQNTDELMYNDCYTPLTTRTFQSIWDTRSMLGNGVNYDYCIPRDVNFGCAVTGIKDVQNLTKPVHLSIDRWDEPNVTVGETAVMLNATINIDSLTIGEHYVLLRYNDYSMVPSSGFDPTTASSSISFTATGTTYSTTDTFMSNATVFYRCVKDNFTGINEPTSAENEINIYPNPSNGFITITSKENCSIDILNSLGQIMITQKIINPITTIDFKDLIKGVYTMRMTTQKNLVAKKFVVQ
jgi:hypothetical protein